MKATYGRSSESRLRVLLLGRSGTASDALAVWVNEQSGATIAGPAAATAKALALADTFVPDVVLLDFHGLSGGSTAHIVSLLKKLSVPPLVVVLTHDGSDAMRRRCREASVDAVFDKTNELDALVTLLTDTQVALT
jgi:DNA-binding NarL/FixJ family response regulator